MPDLDFIGFKFNGHYSKDQGILRVSKGDRYQDDLIPVFQDETYYAKGATGTYYWDSYYTQRSFTLDIAFDHLTEEGLRNLRRCFAANTLGDLIFEECPYKVYTAKVQSPPSLNYICFDEVSGNTEIRVYKGEGTIQFICFFPFAHSREKYLNLYNDFIDENLDEWAGASGLLSSQGTYDQLNSTSIKLYNPGDVETNYIAYYSLSNVSSGQTVTLTQGSVTRGTLVLGAIVAQGSDTYIGINSRTNLIEGYTKVNNVYVKTNNIYNSYITAGDFFKIPVNDGTVMNFNSNHACAQVMYNYLYY